MRLRLWQLTKYALDTNDKFTQDIDTLDAYGRNKQLAVTDERPLTVYLNRREIVTLMTMGSEAGSLVLGYLKNQRLFIPSLEASAVDIQVDWSVNAAAVKVEESAINKETDLDKKTVTSGCGQGTVYGDLLNDLDARPMQQCTIRQSQIYRALGHLVSYNEIYRTAGAVHGCALLDENQSVRYFVEDVGRHNAADAISGKMWLDAVTGQGKWFYTTGRLTSEMVIKSVQMGISVLLSRSGVTAMGIELARKFNVVLIARAKGKYFIVYNGSENIILDQMPRDETGHKS